MGAPKPALGYPSRTAAVVALRNQGKTFAQIGRMIGITAKTASALAHSAQRSHRHDLNEIRPDAVLDGEAINALQPYATRRGLTVGELVCLLIETVVEDQIIDAVLDDGAFAALASETAA
ncbi:hypothetical protein DDZ14_08385 [Maritimibacter sp. 55A14]|uniref:hypothetical protein n=1 Tax=Maritimibacter sp. 55A14 TaxID=2174844 RepID=UPI000D61A85B|nr:hypothetical protein [Maritimibacter sp. 55A14]PWE32754.1 hypothetical protein DDZ14_08385 [Maritimibacter sp. 55A14]